jgi:hypothetical protein
MSAIVWEILLGSTALALGIGTLLVVLGGLK